MQSALQNWTKVSFHAPSRRSSTLAMSLPVWRYQINRSIILIQRIRQGFCLKRSDTLCMDLHFYVHVFIKAWYEKCPKRKISAPEAVSLPDSCITNTEYSKGFFFSFLSPKSARRHAVFESFSILRGENWCLRCLSTGMPGREGEVWSAWNG